ncbi:MAG: hypothetical protein GY838_17070 [bacterium]|nr:hypothetical protein [bacterium]
MIRHPLLRSLAGALLGAFAGTSLALSVLPLVLRWGGFGDDLELTRVLSSYVPHAAAICAGGGWSAARTGFPLAGGLVMAVAGLAAGLVVAAVGVGTALLALVLGGIGGLVYGFLGGLIIVRLLVPPPTFDDAEEPRP